MDMPDKMEIMEQKDDLLVVHSSPEIEQLLTESLTSRRASTFPVGCLLVGVDRFSEINDIYGQEVGNEVLRRVAKLVANLSLIHI